MKLNKIYRTEGKFLRAVTPHTITSGVKFIIVAAWAVAIVAKLLIY